jgi:hypothetical protein
MSDPQHPKVWHILDAWKHRKQDKAETIDDKNAKAAIEFTQAAFDDLYNLFREIVHADSSNKTVSTSAHQAGIKKEDADKLWHAFTDK